jgi:hypothetical protein
MMKARNLFTITIAGGILALSGVIAQAEEVVKEDKLVVELEDGELSDCISDNEHEGFTGVGFVNFDDVEGASVESTFDMKSAGTYSMTMRYANGGTDSRPMKIMVNGKVLAEKQEFSSNDSGLWDIYDTVTIAKVELKAGDNVIKFVCLDYDGPNLDNVIFVKTSKASKPAPKAEKK